jgi:PIN domain nuclease of toxin-antitoxin system
LWEIATFAQCKRISLDLDSPEWFQVIARVRIWPLDLALARAKLHFESDPADEIIAATSLVHRVPLVTRDRRIRRSKPQHTPKEAKRISSPVPGVRGGSEVA